jgi:hypothetical protein
MKWFKDYYEKRKKRVHQLAHGQTVSTNGVGPFALNWLLPQFNFRTASDLHDLAYARIIITNKKKVHLFTKEQADIAFKKRMLRLAKKHKHPKLAACFARVYYWAVHNFGHAYYEGFGNWIKGLFRL